MEGEKWQRITEIFDAAIQTEPKRRSLLVESLSKGDSLLRSEIMRLLSNFDNAGSFLEEAITSVPNLEKAFLPGQLAAGRFRIIRFLGAGGMGEVYEVQDEVTHDRLAIKAIRSEVADDPRVKLRLRQELTIARQISHPNVCKMFEFWEQRTADGCGADFLTMELLSGETIAQRLQARGPFPAAVATELVKQIASGLEQVHRLGIVHRDLKPSNLFLVGATAGKMRVVVTDFGLARLVDADAWARTRTGFAMGTPAYMAPEQFEGQEASSASDIYSLGVTMLEMITGRRAPLVSPSSLVSSLNPGWDRAVLQCIEPDPAKRPTSPAEVLALLDGAGSRPKAFLRKHGTWIGGAAVIAVLTAILFTKRPESKPAVITRITFNSGAAYGATVSEDGRLAAYASDRGPRGDFNIWVQDLGSGSNRQVTDDPTDETEPAISPDRMEVAFRSEKDGGGIWRVSVAGGEPTLVAAKGRNPRYSPDAKSILYWTGQPSDHSMASGRIWIAPAQGGLPRQIAKDFADARLPAWSDDGSRILFRGARRTAGSLDDATDWWVSDASGESVEPAGAYDVFRKEDLTLFDGPVAWRGGRVVFAARAGHSTNLYSIGLTTTNRRVDQTVRRLTTSSDSEVSPWIERDGSIIYSTVHIITNIWRAALDGTRAEPVTHEDSIDARASVSLDGRRLLFVRRLGEARDVYFRDLQTGKEEPVLRNQAAIPCIRPDGLALGYSVTANARSAIRVQQPKQDGRTQPVCEDCGTLLGWTPDGRNIIQAAESTGAARTIGLIDAASGRKTLLLMGAGLDQAAVSPDGDRVAFTMRDSGLSTTLYTARATGSKPVPAVDWKQLTDGRSWEDKPTWSPDGSALFFFSDRDGNRCIWKQRLDRNGVTRAGPAQPVLHFHRANPSTRYLSVNAVSLSAGGSWLYYTAGTMSANLWMIKP